MYPLQVENIVKKFGDKIAVNNINFQVKQGEIFGLLGANGAGKTTTMRMVLGLIRPDEGQILWQGRGYHDELRSIMGYLPEERGLYPKQKISDQIAYFAELRGVSRSQALQELRMWLDKFGVPEYFNKRVEELSKGNQQKIQFIAAIIHRPQILILDEVFSGLDPVNVEILKESVIELQKQGTTILFSSHRMDHVEELCQHICILDQGKAVVQGKINDIKSSFPKERIILETERPIKNLQQIPGVRDVKEYSNGNAENGYHIRIHELSAAQSVLQLAMQQSAIHRFQIMEPSLNEIFIKMVGEKNE